MGLTHERGNYPRGDMGHQRHGISMNIQILNLKDNRLGAKSSTRTEQKYHVLKKSVIRSFVHRTKVNCDSQG